MNFQNFLNISLSYSAHQIFFYFSIVFVRTCPKHYFTLISFSNSQFPFILSAVATEVVTLYMYCYFTSQTGCACSFCDTEQWHNHVQQPKATPTSPLVFLLITPIKQTLSVYADLNVVPVILYCAFYVVEIIV